MKDLSSRGVLRFRLLVLLAAWFLVGCGRPDGLVVYTTQDRVFAEPVLREAERVTGVRLLAVYDNEANKGAALAQRLLAEAGRPRADLWWSNDEMRTRQLVWRGALDDEVRTFGIRRRVLVLRAGDSPGPELGTPGLHWLTNAALGGQVAVAYPLFGTTTAHLLVLRQRWGAAAWETWCRQLMANRPLLVDGNSRVVRSVAMGQARVGLTDSDDVRFAVREGLAVVALALPEAEDLVIRNSVALVRGGGRAGDARRVADWLAGPEVLAQLVAAGGSDPVEAAAVAGVGVSWRPLFEELDPAVEQLRGWFVR